MALDTMRCNQLAPLDFKGLHHTALALVKNQLFSDGLISMKFDLPVI